MNSFAPINPKLFEPSPQIKTGPDGHGGYTAKLQAADTIDAMRSACSSALRDFPQSFWVDPKDRADKARENDKNNTWPVNFCDRFTNQDPTHECTTHSEVVNFIIARNYHRGLIFPDGPKKDFRYEESQRGSVWPSPLSVYIEANPGQWGGAGVIQVLDIACRRGHLPDKIQPFDYGFKHYLHGTTGKGNSNQSSGPWVKLKNLPEGWQDTGKLLMPKEVIVTDDWEQALCIVLNGRAFSVGRKGHAIPYTHWNEREQAMGYVDSYNVIRWDSASTVRQAVRYGGFSIISTTTPDDWMKPAA